MPIAAHKPRLTPESQGSPQLEEGTDRRVLRGPIRTPCALATLGGPSDAVLRGKEQAHVGC